MNRFLNRVSSLIMMLLSVIPIVHLIMCTFSLNADERLPLFLVIAVVFCWLVFSSQRFTLPGIIVCCALAFLFYRGRAEIISVQFSDILDKILDIYLRRFTAGSHAFTAHTDTHSEALLFIGFILSALLGISLHYREERTFISALVVLPLVCFCLLVYGNIPAWIMLCLSIFMFMLICTGRCFDIDGSLGRSFFVLILPVSLLLGALLLYKGPDKYDYEKQDLSLMEIAQELTQKLTAFISVEPDSSSSVTVRSPSNFDASFETFTPTPSDDGSGGALDASALPDPDQLQQILMQVTAQHTGWIYLRQNSYGSYTGTGWTSAPVYPGDSVPAFAAAAVAQAEGAYSENIDIKLISADSTRMYVPYFSSLDLNNESYISGSSSEYSLSYTLYDGGYKALQLPSELKDEELSYRQYVHSNYLSLPENTRTSLLQIAQENQLSGNDVYETIYNVAQLVRGSCEYNIYTLPYPSDDYAIYLLTEASEGYCVHFATSAAAMCRALGLPARVATGVLVDAVAGTAVDVQKLNEHAWMEVYIDGLGWLPVEVTPGALDSSASGSDPSPSETPQPEDMPSSPSPEPSGQSDSTAVEPEVQQKAEDTSSSAISKTPLIILGCIVMIAAAALGWYYGFRAIWKHRFTAEKNRAAIYVWRFAKRVTAYGGTMPEAIEASARKAFYGKGLENQQELDTAITELERLKAEVYDSLPWYRKFFFRYIHGLK